MATEPGTRPPITNTRNNRQLQTSRLQTTTRCGFWQSPRNRLRGIHHAPKPLKEWPAWRQYAGYISRIHFPDFTLAKAAPSRPWGSKQRSSSRPLARHRFAPYCATRCRVRLTRTATILAAHGGRRRAKPQREPPRVITTKYWQCDLHHDQENIYTASMRAG